MGMTPHGWSVNALATELGRDRRTIAKRLAEAGVEPVEVNGRVRLYRLRDALDVLEAPPSPQPARSAAYGSNAERVFDFAMASPRRYKLSGLAVQSWNGVAALFGASDDDIREWLRFGCPYLRSGDAETGKGWKFSIPHLGRWIALWGAALDRMGVTRGRDEPVAETTRRLCRRYPQLAALAFEDDAEDEQ